MGNSFCYYSGEQFGCTDVQFGRSHKRVSAIPKKSAITPVTIVQPLKVNTLVHDLSKTTMQPSPQQKTQIDDQNGPEQIQQDINNKELTWRDREIIAKCWRTYIQTGRRDIFHKTMLFCIEASPKLNEIIACQRYCYRDLTKWPKLDRICKAQFNFYEKLIYELNMDEKKMRDACTRLGETHANYAQYGMKPHFLDIYHQQLLGLIASLPFQNSEERQETVAAFNRFISFIIDIMNQAYSLKASEKRNNKRPSKTAL